MGHIWLELVGVSDEDSEDTTYPEVWLHRTSSCFMRLRECWSSHCAGFVLYSGYDQEKTGEIRVTSTDIIIFVKGHRRDLHLDTGIRV